MQGMELLQWMEIVRKPESVKVLQLTHEYMMMGHLWGKGFTLDAKVTVPCSRLHHYELHHQRKKHFSNSLDRKAIELFYC